MNLRLTPAERPSKRDLVFDGLSALGLTLGGWLQIVTVTVVFSEGGQRFGHGPGPFGPPPTQPPTWLAFALIAAAYLPLAVRRRFPLSTLLAATSAAVVYELMPNPPALIFFAPLIATYTVATLYGRRTSWLATGVAVLANLSTSLPHVDSKRIVAEVLRVTALFLFAAALGDAQRNRRAYVAEVEARALEAEHTREEEARRRVEEERLRIARELHDVTAHSLSIIAVQAGAAAKVAEKDPGAARASLETIRTTAKSSLDELRAMLGVLRGDEGAPLAPTGTLARLPELAHAVEQAGVRVVLDVSELGEVPAYADVSAYRIVQEALTNVVRHARATTATVRVSRDAGGLAIEVRDDGAGAGSATATPGHGIAGMGERVAALGGTFSAGAEAGGGFAVRARLPLEKAGA